MFRCLRPKPLPGVQCAPVSIASRRFKHIQYDPVNKMLKLEPHVETTDIEAINMAMSMRTELEYKLNLQAGSIVILLKRP